MLCIIQYNSLSIIYYEEFYGLGKFEAYQRTKKRRKNLSKKLNLSLRDLAECTCVPFTYKLVKFEDKCEVIFPVI